MHWLVQNVLSHPQFLLEESNQMKKSKISIHSIYHYRNNIARKKKKKNTYLIKEFGFKFTSTMIRSCNSWCILTTSNYHLHTRQGIQKHITQIENGRNQKQIEDVHGVLSMMKYFGTAFILWVREKWLNFYQEMNV